MSSGRRTLPKTVLHPSRVALLQRAFAELEADTRTAERLARDPLSFVRRYDDPLDQEVAAVFASGLAYGRVAAFWPVLTELFEVADAHGGPRRWVEGFDVAEAREIRHLVYRFTRGPHLALLALALQGSLARWGRLGAAFEAASRRSHKTVAPALDAVVGELRAEALAAAPRLGLRARCYEELPRGFRYFLPRPAEGSACKRWNMALRWLVRPPGEGPQGVDLGLWDLPTRQLVIPLDTHVARLSRFIGLTRRTDGSWRTAEEITRNLARLDPEDPVRFDFALAHLGMSGACRQERVPEICDVCGLVPVCRVGAPRSGPRAGPRTR